MSRRAATKEANRAALVIAARDAFAAHGYAATGVRDVVRRTGLAAGTFYNYFDSKEAIFAAVLEEVGGEARDRVRTARLAAPRERFLEAGFREFFAFVAAEPATFAFLDRNADAIVPAALDELREDLRGRLGDGVDLDYAAHAMLAAGLQIGRVMLTRDPVSVDQATAFAVVLFRGILR
jgi:AcrR family transcriptional regulator